MQLFEIGERVAHLSKLSMGVVTGYIGGEDQRYYVRHSGWVWSVPQRYLDSEQTLETLKKGFRESKAGRTAVYTKTTP